MELKSEFKQAADRAITQYRTTRLPVDPATKKPEPLITFKRGALERFAVSQYEVAMTTRLAAEATTFLPFNRGTKEGGAGNDVPDDVNRYATDYLWNEVLLPDNLLNILARFVHLEIKEKEDWDGRKYKQETMSFPRYHQWEVVGQLIKKAREEGPGQTMRDRSSRVFQRFHRPTVQIQSPSRIVRFRYVKAQTQEPTGPRQEPTPQCTRPSGIRPRLA
ncbi:MAG: hypothetical protein J6386_02690 [Candidatus Synoicihabitans palmerolidicus]|nr:hypothetical protein [Candidatus Synoicihabitans palmerolidicus]